MLYIITLTSSTLPHYPLPSLTTIIIISENKLNFKYSNILTRSNTFLIVAFTHKNT